MLRFSRLLAQKGYQIALICRHQGGIPEAQFPREMTFFQLSSTAFRIKYTEIRNYIDVFQPDIVHLHYLAKDCLIPALRLQRPYRYLISVWGSDINIDAGKLLNRVVQSFGLLLCDRIHILSSYFENKMRHLYPLLKREKLEIFSWGVAYNFLSRRTPDEERNLRNLLGIGSQDRVVLSYRNHQQIYNHHTLIRAIPIICEKFPETKFVFTRSSFDPFYLEKSRQLVEELAIDNKFIFIDRWLSDNELRNLRHLADCIVNIPFQDGLPATLFEIMATKAIPVVTELLSYKSFFIEEENGFYLKEPTSHYRLAEIIEKVFSNLEYFRNKFSTKNNSYIREHQNWSKQSALFLNFYTTDKDI